MLAGHLPRVNEQARPAPRSCCLTDAPSRSRALGEQHLSVRLATSLPGSEGAVERHDADLRGSSIFQDAFYIAFFFFFGFFLQ